jgi:CelD/BcsL family acetyltransferase involved in cellulose biosynthesis
MVDVGLGQARRQAAAFSGEATDTARSITARVVPLTTGLAVPMPQDAVVAPAQTPAFIAAWIDAMAPDAFCAVLERDGQVVLTVALEVAAQRGLRVARLLGETHANGNFPAASRGWLASARREDVELLVAAIGRSRPDLDAVAFDRLLPALDGVGNPLLRLPHRPHENLSLAVDISAGFDTVLAGHSGKRKRKRHRNNQRKFEAEGGHRRIVARTVDEVRRLLDTFFAMKAARFAKAGIDDVFAPPGVRRFFTALFTSALAASPPAFVLHGLEVGGQIRAVTGSARRGDTLICEFGAIDEEAAANISPGEFLFFENIGEACAQGFSTYDFSVGDEPYKRQWCDVETVLGDVAVPFSLRGRVQAAVERPVGALRMMVKRNARLTAAYRRLRRHISGRD